MKRFNLLSVILPMLIFLISSTIHSAVFELSDSSNYELRFDGANDEDQTGNVVVTGDLNGDGIPDLVIAAKNASFNRIGVTS